MFQSITEKINLCQEAVNEIPHHIKRLTQHIKKLYYNCGTRDSTYQLVLQVVKSRREIPASTQNNKMHFLFMDKNLGLA